MADQLLGSTLYKLTECKIIIFASIMDHLQQLWNAFCVRLRLKLKPIFYLQIDVTATTCFDGTSVSVFLTLINTHIRSIIKITHNKSDSHTSHYIRINIFLTSYEVMFLSLSAE